MAVWYLGSTKWTAVTAWAALTSYSVGDLRRQLAAPTVGQERVFRCTTAGISGVAEPAPWTLTKGGTTTDATAVWTEVTGDTAYGWTAAHARLANALAWMAAGDTVYVSQASAETQATTITLTSPGTAASPCNVLCVDDSATPPTALATTATVTTTGNSNMQLLGFVYVYGVTFNVGTGAGGAQFSLINTSPVGGIVFDTCAVAMLNTGGGSDVVIGSNAANGAYCRLVNTTIRLAANAGSNLILADVRFFMDGGAFVTTSTPTAVLVFTSLTDGYARFRGVDLSLFGSGKALVTLTSIGAVDVLFEQCKLGASVALTTGTAPGFGGPRVWLENCDSGDTQTRMQRHQYEGDVYSETTIVRTSGASDGTTPLSHKLVSSANTKFAWPLYGPEMWVYNSATGSSKTVTVETVHDSLSELTDGDLWLDTEYLGTSGVPLALFASDSKGTILATATDQATSSATWTTTGFSTAGTPHKLVTTFTPQEVGIVRCRVVLATPSTTVYVDPKLTVA